MAYKYYKEALIPNKIKGKEKPFIDQNLQLRIPDLEMANQPKTYLPLYGHYSTSGTLSSPVDEQAIDKAMAEARHSHKAWKKLQNHLQATFLRQNH